MRQSLEGVSVEKVMVGDVVTVSPELCVEEAAQEYFLRYGHGGFPVVQEGKAVGVISLMSLKDVPAEERRARTVRDTMVPLSAAIQIQADDSLVEALKKMTQAGMGRLLVMRGDQYVGMITKSGLLRFMEIKQVLGQ